jgi:hypothetical protein
MAFIGHGLSSAKHCWVLHFLAISGLVWVWAPLGIGWVFAELSIGWSWAGLTMCCSGLGLG